MNLFGQNYEGTTGIHMDDKIYLYGLHEAATVRLMRDILVRQKQQGTSPVYMDIGTNAGMHLIAVADLADKAYGFEPWHTVREKALHNVTINKLDHVTVFDFGLSDEDADLPFRPPENNNLGVGMFVDTTNDETIILKVCKGDDIVSKNNIKPTLMKMDVEGHEKKALTGLHDTIREFKPDIVFEYSDGSREDLGDPQTLKELFGDNYKFYGIKRSREKPALEPFNPSKKYENVLATTAAL